MKPPKRKIHEENQLVIVLGLNVTDSIYYTRHSVINSFILTSVIYTF